MARIIDLLIEGRMRRRGNRQGTARLFKPARVAVAETFDDRMIDSGAPTSPKRYISGQVTLTHARHESDSPSSDEDADCALLLEWYLYYFKPSFE